VLRGSRRRRNSINLRRQDDVSFSYRRWPESVLKNISLSQVFTDKNASFGWRLSFFLFHGATAPIGPGPPHYRGCTITLRHTTIVRTPTNEWSARRKITQPDKTQHSQEKDIHAPTGIPGSQPPKTHVLDSTAPEIGHLVCRLYLFIFIDTPLYSIQPKFLGLYVLSLMPDIPMCY